MDRLTVKWTDGIYDTFDPVDVLDNDYSKINYKKIVAKLGEYEDLEEQGLLLRLPCKVGDIVYKIVNQRDNYDDIVYQIVSAAIFELSMIDKIGKTVFLTKAEAEQKLKEIQNNLKDGE